MSVVPRRVVMVCGSLQPGGAERQVANTLIGLSERSLESVTLLCDYLDENVNADNGFYLPLAQKSGSVVRVIETDEGARERGALPPEFVDVARELPAAIVADIVNLYHEFRALRPEVVHAWLDWSNVRAGIAAVLAGVPKVILSGRNLSPRHFALNTEYFYPAYAALAERSREQVIFLNNSRAGADDYAQWLSLPPESIKVLRNGVEFDEEDRPSPKYNLAFRRQRGIPEDAPLVGGMFRFNPEKRPLLWLETAAQVSARLPETHFVIFGKGEMRADMENRVQALGIEGRVHFCDLITPSLNGLAPCDLVLLTSSGEGTPNVLLEAQWLGLPVVTTNAGGAAEAVHNGITGLVVENDEAASIADAVTSILRDEAFREGARQEGPAFVASRYGMRRMIDETLDAYRIDAPATVSPAIEKIVEVRTI